MAMIVEATVAETDQDLEETHAGTGTVVMGVKIAEKEMARIKVKMGGIRMVRKTSKVLIGRKDERQLAKNSRKAGAKTHAR